MAAEHKIFIPEPPAEMNPTALKDIWKKRQSLERSKIQHHFSFYLRQAITLILELPFNSVITIVTIAVTLFLFSSVVLILNNLSNWLGEVGDSRYLSAYIRTDAEQKELTKFAEMLRQDPAVESVLFVSKEDALKSLIQELGSYSGFLEGMQSENPLPSSFDVHLKPVRVADVSAEDFAASIRGNSIVEDITFSSKWAERMRETVKIFRSLSLLAIAVIAAIIIFLIANTIRLIIYAQREELEIMQLIGAGAAFIKVPYLLCGFLQGFLGSIFALAILKSSFAVFRSQFNDLAVVGVLMPKLTYLAPAITFSILIVGIVVGMVGSYLAVERYVHSERIS